MNISMSPEVLFAKYGQKCLENDALRERIYELEQLLEAQRGVAAHNNALDPNNDPIIERQHTNGQSELPL